MKQKPNIENRGFAQAHWSRRSAFTLTELLVAIGLLMIIMLSVSTVFRATGDTVSTGLATIDTNRRMLTAHITLAGDISGFGADPFDPGQGMWPANAKPSDGDNPPFLIIRNNARYAFFDRAEWVALGSPNDFSGIPGTELHKYIYRTDSLAFFSRGVYKRQTGGHRNPSNGNNYYPLVNDMWGLDRAYIWYGHARQPDNNGNWNQSYNHGAPTDQGAVFFNPGTGNPSTNPNNFFATQWILARSCIALVQPENHPLTTPPFSNYEHFVRDLNQNAVYYYGRDDLTNNPTNLAPLSDGRATCGDGNFINAERIWESRYDIAGLNAVTTWSDYADIINRYWLGSGTYTNPQRPSWAEDRFSTRFRVNPFAIGETPAGDPATFAAYASQQVPIFLPGCTQFIVEFAGDYVAQDDDGDIDSGEGVELNPNSSSSYHLDGVTDYDVVEINGERVRRIHWYGMPRRTDGTIGPIRLGDDARTLVSGDVTTVSQMRSQDVNVSDPLMPFEWWDSAAGVYTCGWTQDMLVMPDSPDADKPMSLAPHLIRITVQVVDPEGRVRDGMTRQFIFPVKRITY